MDIDKMFKAGTLNEPGEFLYHVYVTLKELAVHVSEGTFSKEEVLIALAAITDDIKCEVENG